MDAPKESQINALLERTSVPVLRNIAFDYLPCKVYGIEVKGMLDTGANISVISEAFVRKNKLDRLMERT